MGAVPTAAERRDHFIRVQKLLGWNEAKWLGDSLIASDAETNVEPYDPDHDARMAARRGIDLTADPDWQQLKRLVDEARERASSRKPPATTRSKARAQAFKTERRSERERRRGEVARKGPPSSKRSREAWRRDPKRDQATIAEIKQFFDVQVGVRLVASKTALVRAQKEYRAESGPASEHPDPMVIVPHWEKASHPMRIFAMSVAAGKLGARDFTLHLNDAVLEYALGGDGQSFAKRMLRRLKDSLASEYGALGLPTPEFFFQVEQAVGEAPHLHGVVAISPGSSLAPLKAGLRKAGGEPWKRTPYVDTQADIGGLAEPVGWASYIGKFTETTKRAVGDNISAATVGMTAMGRNWYQRARTERELLLPGKAVAL